MGELTRNIHSTFVQNLEKVSHIPKLENSKSPVFSECILKTGGKWWSELTSQTWWKYNATNKSSKNQI